MLTLESAWLRRGTDRWVWQRRGGRCADVFGVCGLEGGELDSRVDEGAHRELDQWRPTSRCLIWDGWRGRGTDGGTVVTGAGRPALRWDGCRGQGACREASDGRRGDGEVD